MELWIRSQDKEQLIKVDEVYIEEILDTTIFITNKYNVGEWLIQCNDTILGVYKTKERALEVLDEIESLIVGNTRYLITGEQVYTGIKSKDLQSVLYEMPKEK